jgi:hypothetical protein
MNLSGVKEKLKNKQDLTFLSLGILMSILVFSGIFYAVNFLTLEIGDVLGNEKPNLVAPTKFNLSQINALGIENMQK